MSENTIVAEHVTKRFSSSDRPAVDDLSFTVESGELVVLLGPSGCGKTTVLKMLNRLYDPTSGTILVSGRDVAEVPGTELRRSIGYVIQETGLFPHMSIEQNIAVVPELLGWDKPRTDERIEELLELLGLPDDYRGRKPRQLSGGERQRVGIARAMAADPQIMLMDEPFGALDAITRVRLQAEFLRIQDQVRKTIVFVTHDVDEAVRLADRILVMREGKAVQVDTPRDVVTSPADEFVAELLKTDDAIHRLSMLTIEGLIETSGTGGEFREHGPAGDETPAGRSALSASAGPSRPADPSLPTVELDSDLRTALDRLLDSDAETLVLVDEEGAAIGEVGFDDLRRATQSHSGAA